MSNYFITNKGANPINISEDDYSQICTESSLLFKYKKLIIAWLTYHQALEALDSFKNNGIIDLLDKYDLNNFALPNVYVGNVLNAFYMFEQYCEHYFEECFKGDSNLKNGIKQYIYDNNFSYRFIYNLRIYSTHNEMPILKVGGQYDLNKGRYINPKFTASKTKFCNAKGLQRKVQEEAKTALKTEDVDVYKYLSELDELLFNVVLKIFKYGKNEIIDVYNHWYSYDSTKDKNTDLYLWKDSNVDIYLTSYLYMTYKHFEKHLLMHPYVRRHPVNDDSISIRDLCNSLKTILRLDEERP
ncbi:MAG: hypothetical protein MRZ17_06195 [Acholeplasmataceae bacterium]|nr:hypothetical protein [Acholeplasmataceae bacterium]